MNNLPHLLIVDANPHVVTILKQTLRNDFVISTAHSGPDAMRLLSQGNRFDCVITELNLPNSSGFDLMKTIRFSRQMKQTSILVLTDAPDSNTRIRCLEEGADSVIAKPFNPLEIKAKLIAVMRRAELAAQPVRSIAVSTGAVKAPNRFQQLTSRILSLIV
jgi:DNA-binding response OmpR family regulator